MSQLLIFDFDGTLADTWRDIATALNRTLGGARLPAAADGDVRQWIGEGVRRLIERALPEPARSPERIDELAAAFAAHYAQCCTETTALYPAIAECLDAVSRHPLAILSNKPTRFLIAIAEHLGIASRFATIVGGDRLPVAKPDPAAVKQVVRAVGVVCDTIWMIGDSAVDVAAGARAGARTIGCAWGLRGAAELRAAGAEFIVETPDEIRFIVG